MHRLYTAQHQGALFKRMTTWPVPTGFVQYGSRAHTWSDTPAGHQVISSLLGRSSTLASQRKLWKECPCHCVITPFQWLLSMTITMVLRPMLQFCFSDQITLAPEPCPPPHAMPINTHLQQISFNSNGPLVNLHSAKLTFPNMFHGTVRVRKIYCQEPKICYLVKYGFFHGLIWTLYRKLWSSSMIIHHLRKGKGSAGAFRGHIS